MNRTAVALSPERDRTDTFLGVKFWDRLTRTIVSEGLQVTAQRLVNNKRVGKRIVGRRTPNGTIAFFGLFPEEKPPENQPPFDRASVLDRLAFVEVEDMRGRFLPMSFVAQSRFGGAFVGNPVQGATGTLFASLHWPTVAPNEALGVQLWSAPARAAPSGVGQVLGQLVVGPSSKAKPAAYAVVTVQTQPVNNAPALEYYGMTDREGMLSIMLPYPPPKAIRLNKYPSLDKQTYSLKLSVRYDPNSPQRPTAGPNSAQQSIPTMTDLLGQSRRKVITDTATPTGQANVDVDLQFGRPLILGTQSNGVKESVLRLESIP